MAGIAGRAGLGWWARSLRAVAGLFRARPSGRDGVWLSGEDAAASYLQDNGFVILQRNAQTSAGEADLVARAPDGTLVVVEVKARTRGQNARSDSLPTSAALTRAKLRRLRAIASHLARANRLPNARIDLITVDFPLQSAPVVRHHPGVG